MKRLYKRMILIQWMWKSLKSMHVDESCIPLRSAPLTFVRWLSIQTVSKDSLFDELKQFAKRELMIRKKQKNYKLSVDIM